MDLMDFQKMKTHFVSAEVDEKINMYVSAEGLTQTQYKELLKLFPLAELPRLEAALS